MRVRAALFSLVAVALVTGAVYALRPVAPVLSLGVIYLFAVLPVAALWGFRWAVAVSLVSMLTFNFLFLPPTHTFRLANSENWVALAVYLLTAVSVSELSARARRRAAEADRLALEAIGPENQRIEAVLPEESPPVRVDAAQLEHALVNLLENALKFSSPTDRIELSAETVGREVVVRVVDHGPGIPANERERIFEPFARGANGDV